VGKASGWRHPANENDWVDYLSKEFFDLGKEKNKTN